MVATQSAPFRAGYWRSLSEPVIPKEFLNWTKGQCWIMDISLHVLLRVTTKSFAMRFATKVMVALVVVPAVLTHTPANALPYDPYPWCADYSGDNGGGGTNCGFLTIGQCRATVSGIGGFCVPNQFYNPGRSRSSR